MSFSFEIETKKNTVIIRPVGSLIEKSQAEGMLKQVEDNIGKGLCLFILDFSRFDYMNSSGLGVFLTILTKTRSKDGEVIMQCPEFFLQHNGINYYTVAYQIFC